MPCDACIENGNRRVMLNQGMAKCALCGTPNPSTSIHNTRVHEANKRKETTITAEYLMNLSDETKLPLCKLDDDEISTKSDVTTRSSASAVYESVNAKKSNVTAQSSKGAARND